MSMRYKGGVLSATPPTVTISSATGLWTMQDQMRYQAAGTWPPSVIPDPYFEYVTMLLHGDGTNGAQNNTFLDSSTNNFTITRNGNTMQGTFSPFSRANGYWSNYFDGTGDYLSTTLATALQLSGDFTVEVWINLSSAQTNYRMIASDNNGLSSTYISVNSTGLEVQFGNGAGTISSITQTFTVGTWYHVAVVRVGSTVSIYVDGQSKTVSQATQSGTLFLNGGTFYIGRWGNPANEFLGYISNFRIVKGTAVYTSAFTPPTSPLTAITNTSLLTCQSNRFIDNSTNNFTITQNGNVSVQVFSPFNPTTAYSTTTNGGSGYFDGSGDYLTVPDNAAFDMGTGDFTLETWVYITSIPDTTGQTIFGDVNGYDFYLYSRSSGNLEVGMQTFAGGYSQIYTTNNYVKANQWAHIAVARQSGTLRIFVNGVQCTTTGSMPSSLNISATINIARSNYNNANFIYGYLSDLRVVKGTAVYTANFTPPTAPLTAISGTSFLMSCTNAGIFDNAAMFDFETVGGAQVSTVQKKFGTGSLYFDGAGDYLQMPATQNVAFGTGDFTIEFWAYSNDVSGSTQRGHLQISTTAGGFSTGYTTGITFFQGANSALGILNGGLAVALGTGSSYVVVGGSLVLTANQWQHIALTRSGTNARLFVDGVQVGSTVTHSYSLDATNMVLGGYYQTSYYLYQGYLDEVRITKGYARYTANFTPPTAAFPNL